MICKFCGRETFKRKARKVHWFRHRLCIIDDLEEAEDCQQCGERYCHATTLDTIDQLLESGQPVLKEQLRVEVIGMPAQMVLVPRESFT